jgi:hypothetical protein
MSQNTGVMLCKLWLHECGVFPYVKDSLTLRGAKVRFGAVWEGSQENQRKSENAIFGENTPQAEFTATIMNPELVDKLPGLVGKQFYVSFSVVGG